MKVIKTAQVETILILTLGASIFLSKPMIYISTFLIILLTISRTVFDKEYRTVLTNNKLFKLSILLYLTGVVFAIFNSATINDATWLARKSLYLLLIGPLSIAHTKKINITLGIIGVFIGFWCSFLLTANKHNWQWSGQRLEGATWLIDNWASLCGLVIAFLLPLALQKKITNRSRFIIIITLLASLLALITTGARGPLLGTGLGCFIFLAIYHRKVFLGTIVVMIMLLLPTKEIFPDQFSSIKSRIYSIVDTKGNESNQTRIELWKTTVNYFEMLWINDKNTLLMGAGREGFAENLTNYHAQNHENTNSNNAELIKNRILNDPHNMYLDSIGKNGIIWTLGNILFVIFLGITKSYISVNGTVKNKIELKHNRCLPVLITFLTLGIFYSVIPHFVTYFLIFFMTISRSIETKEGLNKSV